MDEHACDVEFFIAYEFRSRTLGMLMGAMFDAAFRRFAGAFERRADEVYGTRRRKARSFAKNVVFSLSRPPSMLVTLFMSSGRFC